MFRFLTCVIFALVLLWTSGVFSILFEHLYSCTEYLVSLGRTGVSSSCVWALLVLRSSLGEQFRHNSREWMKHCSSLVKRAFVSGILDRFREERGVSFKYPHTFRLSQTVLPALCVLQTRGSHLLSEDRWACSSEHVEGDLVFQTSGGRFPFPWPCQCRCGWTLFSWHSRIHRLLISNLLFHRHALQSELIQFVLCTGLTFGGVLWRVAGPAQFFTPSLVEIIFGGSQRGGAGPTFFGWSWEVGQPKSRRASPDSALKKVTGIGWNGELRGMTF